jgi:hypothetical protein
MDLIAHTEGVVVRVRTRWIVGVIFAVLGASALSHYHLRLAGDVLAALALVPIVVAFRMRLAADDSGVTVVNLLRRVRIPWADIDGFRMGWVGLSTCLDVRLRDGRLLHAWVVTTTGAAAYSRKQSENVLGELRRRLARSKGETPEAANASDLEAALRAAENRDYTPLRNFAGDERVDMIELWERVHALVDEVRIDLEEFKTTSPHAPGPRLFNSRLMQLLMTRRERRLLSAAAREDPQSP